MSDKKQRYLSVNKKLIPVSEETYLYHSRWVANERYRARRDHRCGNPNFTKCNGDCGHCIYQIPGDVLYMDSLVETDRDHSEDGDFCIDIPDEQASFEACCRTWTASCPMAGRSSASSRTASPNVKSLPSWASANPRSATEKTNSLITSDIIMLTCCANPILRIECWGHHQKPSRWFVQEAPHLSKQGEGRTKLPQSGG